MSEEKKSKKNIKENRAEHKKYRMKNIDKKNDQVSK